MQETRLDIIHNTLMLTMQYGPKSVSMDDIARHLGMSKKTIYQHFSNKKELIYETVKQTIEKEEEGIKSIMKASVDALDEIVSIARHIIKFIREMGPTVTYDLQKYYPNEWKMVERHHQEFIYNVIKNNIERGQKEKFYLEKINPEIISKLYVGMIFLISDEQKFPPKTVSRLDLFRELVTYHIRGIVSPKGKERIEKLKID